MSKVQVVYVKRRGPKRERVVSPHVSVTTPVPTDNSIKDQLKEARVMPKERLCSSVYGWSR